MLFEFSKTILKNSFKKHKLNIFVKTILKCLLMNSLSLFLFIYFFFFWGGGGGVFKSQKKKWLVTA